MPAPERQGQPLLKICRRWSSRKTRMSCTGRRENCSRENGGADGLVGAGNQVMAEKRTTCSMWRVGISGMVWWPLESGVYCPCSIRYIHSTRSRYRTTMRPPLHTRICRPLDFEAKAFHATPVLLDHRLAVLCGIGGRGEEHALVSSRFFVLAYAARLHIEQNVSIWKL